MEIRIGNSDQAKDFQAGASPLADGKPALFVREGALTLKQFVELANALA
jgi:hypothetical protein